MQPANNARFVDTRKDGSPRLAPENPEQRSSHLPADLLTKETVVVSTRETSALDKLFNLENSDLMSLTLEMIKNLPLDEYLHNLRDMSASGTFYHTKKSILKRMAIVCESLGFQIYTEEKTDNLLITMCGANFLIDIEMNHNNGRINKAKVTLGSEGISYESIDNFITGQLQRGDLRAFTDTLVQFSAVDKSENSDKITLFQQLVVVDIEMSM